MQESKNTTETETGTGLTGLANLGNTCFINACMQIMSNTKELNDFLKDKSYTHKLKPIPDSLLLVEWDKLRELMWSSDCIVSPGRFIKTIHSVSLKKNVQLFTSFSQNDVSEFILFLIDSFHTAISREVQMTISGTPINDTDHCALKCYEMIKYIYMNDYSEIWNIFYAVQISEIRRNDKTRAILSVKPEPFFMVDLPIPPKNKAPSLIECFNHYVEGETIENYYDETSSERITINKQFTFWSFPSVLVIDLKRFNAQSSKIQVHITFPIDNLDLSSYVVGYTPEQYVYELYGVCNHSGSTLGGHYTSYVKTNSGEWFHYNDTSVTPVPMVESIVSTKAYVLFYRKKKIV